VAKKAIDPSDGLVTDVVGPWAAEKHERLKKYIDAYRSARAMFLPPKGTSGAAYIDLFSGPGRSLSWSRLSEQTLRVDKWSLCRG
jgi:hypothetical protein